MTLKVTFHVHVPADDALHRFDDRVAHRPFYQLLDALTALDRDYLKLHPESPSLYGSGVRYLPDTKGEENWYDVATAIERGGGDCKVLAAWRVAELQLRGVAAMCTVFFRELFADDARLYHVQVLLPDGRIEDPSHRLGMPTTSLL